MGKKARKTRWRTLAITDDQSDSETSSTTTAPSQSTPRRKYQHDGIKSTRSSSIASENKITFNEEEYTKITTPRQDVLFKKGYLNKPRNYQTQTSTGTSTTSTGNSTGNGTPDYQSTDLDYESHFVFPNGLVVSQNGMYYLNGYESYPLVYYNVPTYYPEYSTDKSKRNSAGSLTESTSPNNEEVTSQDLSGGEASNNLSDYSGHHNMYNVVYPGYYVNGFDSAHDMNEQSHNEPPKRIKRRKRKKSSVSQTDNNQNSSECSDTDSSTDQCEKPDSLSTEKKVSQKITREVQQEIAHPQPILEQASGSAEEANGIAEEVNGTEVSEVVVVKGDKTELDDTSVIKEETSECLETFKPDKNTITVASETTTDETIGTAETAEVVPNAKKLSKYNLKPDAEEFVPRAYRTPTEVPPPLSPVQLIKVPPNFVPIPIVPFNGQNFNPAAAFIPPPGFPVNFVPPNPKLYPNYVGFVPPSSSSSSPTSLQNKEVVEVVESTENNNNSVKTNDHHDHVESKLEENCDTPSTAKDSHQHRAHQSVKPSAVPAETQHQHGTNSNTVNSNNRKTIDIATIVHKLEEAAKEQEGNEGVGGDSNKEGSPKKQVNNRRYKNGSTNNYKRNYYNSLQNSPQRKNYFQQNNRDGLPSNNSSAQRSSTYQRNFTSNNNISKSLRESPLKQCNHKGMVNAQLQTSNTNVTEISRESTANNNIETKSYFRKSPEHHYKKNWKSHQKYSTVKNQQNYQKDTTNHQQAQNNQQLNKNYSETLKLSIPETQQSNVKHNLPPVVNQTETNVINSKTVTSPVKLPNQWISVHGKKKRKNRVVEENDATTTATAVEQKEVLDDDFETYDVDQLVDVVPPSIQKEQVEQEEEKVVPEPDEINNTFDDSDSQINVVAESVVVVVEEEKVNEVEPIDLEHVVEAVSKQGTFAEDVDQDSSLVKSNVKKSKKGSYKTLTKRVIITDVDLSTKIEEVKTPVKKVVKKIEKTVTSVDVAEKTEDTCDDKKEGAVTSVASSNEDEKKKNKKKKKKTATTKSAASNNSLSSSTTTLNNLEDSFELFNSVLAGSELEEKTNDEISQELDKLIQKGIYSNLEEKMKSLNIDESNGFFKSMFTKIPLRETNTTGFAKIPDFNDILNNASSALSKPNPVSQDVNLQNLELPRIQDGFFLENPGLVEVLEEKTDNNLTTTTTTDKDTTKKTLETPEEIKIEQFDEPKTLYPITEAVKEWMCRTRETTPTVEILKSPKTIYKEFCNNQSDSESESEINKITTNTTTTEDHEIEDESDRRSVINNYEDEEITIFTTDDKELNNDLLDYWEDVPVTTENIDVPMKQSDPATNPSRNNDNDEEIEIYESKFGENKDFLDIQRECQEQSSNNNDSQNTGLPYRAVCCNVM